MPASYTVKFLPPSLRRKMIQFKTCHGEVQNEPPIECNSQPPEAHFKSRTYPPQPILCFQLSRSSSRWEPHFHFYVLRIYARLCWSRETVSFNSPVRRGYIHKVNLHLVQKYFPHNCSTDIISFSEQKILESDENNIKMRQRLDRENTMLLLPTWNQGKSTLRCRCQSTGPVVDPLPPPFSSSIPYKRCLSSADASFVVVVVFVLIFFLQRFCRCRRFLGPVV